MSINRPQVPDYELEEILVVSASVQLRAFAVVGGAMLLKLSNDLLLPT